jgi:uncharacterized protein
MSASVAQIGFGQVRHTRLRPAHNAFIYPTYFLLLPLRSLRANGSGSLARNRWAPLSFYDRDHGDGRADSLAWLDELLQAQGVTDATGETWLHCYPRVLGHTFKPVSFWYCHDADNRLRAIVVEVNNTFGQRHCYLLDKPAFGAQLKTEKVFHVSPFCEGSYRFRFLFDAARLRTVARIDYDDPSGPLLQTSVSGSLEPVTPASLRQALWQHPLMTLGVVARIHWQALRLASKRVKFFSKPPAPDAFVTR